MPEISAAVLAGGKSRRLGIDKSLLKLNGEWLLERILTTLSALSADLLVVGGGKPEFASLSARVVPDDLPGAGPLGGIYSGLRAMRHARGLFVACDMPLLNLSLLRYMILLSADFDVVIPRIGDQTEPLHAIYSKACVGPIEGLLQRNELRVIHFFHQVRVRYVIGSEIEVFDPGHESFSNINTPDDLQRAEEIAKPLGKRASTN